MWKSHCCQIIEDGIIKFCVRYVDYTFLVIKRTDISYVLSKFNSLDENLKFTIGTFTSCETTFPWHRNLSKLVRHCHKYSQTGQYVNSDSFTIWKGKMSWIHSLVTKAKRICSENYLNKETQLIKNYAACNVCRSTFLISVRNEHCVIKCLIKSQKKVPQIL